jgi:hypothetical protein
MKILASVLLLVAAFPCSAQDLALRVRATRVKLTDICSNCTPSNLHIAYWTVYDARVKKVMDGKFSNRSVRFAYAQHAQYTREVLKDFVVVLKPAPEWLRNQTGADYEVVEFRMRRR